MKLLLDFIPLRMDWEVLLNHYTVTNAIYSITIRVLEHAQHAYKNFQHPISLGGPLQISFIQFLCGIVNTQNFLSLNYCMERTGTPKKEKIIKKLIQEIQIALIKMWGFYSLPPKVSGGVSLFMFIIFLFFVNFFFFFLF